MSEFKREERYIVIKRKHHTEDQIIALKAFLQAMDIVEEFDGVVVEKDWPNYEHVWKTIEQIEDQGEDWCEPETLPKDYIALPLSAWKEQMDIEKQRDELVSALRGVVGLHYCTTCNHEETYRGGAIWEICRNCGAKWADDEGGKPEFKEPKEILDSEKLLLSIRLGENS